MTKMMRRPDPSKPWHQELGRWADTLLGNTEGRISLLDDDGVELDLIDGTTVSSNNYAGTFRSAAGRHGLFQHSSGTPTILDIRDTGITASALTVTGATLLNGNVTLGDAAADTLTVEATSTFKANVTFLVNVTIGDAAGDTLTVNSTPTFNAGLTVASGVLTVPAGSAALPSVAVGEATTGLFRQAAGVLGLSSGGAERVRLTSNDVFVPASTVTLANNIAYRVTDTGGTPRQAVKLDAADILQVGGTGFGTVNLNTATTLKVQANGTTRIEANTTGVGFFATTPVAQPAAAAAATDLASVITLANSLRTGLRGATGLGLFS